MENRYCCEECKYWEKDLVNSARISWLKLIRYPKLFM